MKEQELEPLAPILVESTRSIGYSFETALADIIDNSVSAEAKRIDVDFDSNLPPWLTVKDDGYGMSEKELIDAMRFGSKSSLEARSPEDLGRFGLGLKTASLSQCRILTVLSKRKGSPIVAARWDLDYVYKTQKWMLQILSEEELKGLPNDVYAWLSCQESGTVVVWQNFDRVQGSKKSLSEALTDSYTYAEDHVELVFHRFLSNEIPSKRVEIYFNGNKLEGKDPFLEKNPATQQQDEEFIKINGIKVSVKPYILPYYSHLTKKDRTKMGIGNDDLRSRQGFYIYRNRRLIVWGTWFKMFHQGELGKLARVKIDFPNSLDSVWEIDVKKATATLPYNIRKKLQTAVFRALNRSSDVITYPGIKTNNDGFVHMWERIQGREGKIQYHINQRHPLCKQLFDSLSDAQQKNLDQLLRIIEDSFPFSVVYSDVAKDPESVAPGNVEDDKIYQAAKSLLELSVQEGRTLEEAFKGLLQQDFLKPYPNTIKQIKQEYHVK